MQGLMSYAGKISREQLIGIPTPLATATHHPVPHHDVINALVETLSFRHMDVIKDEYAVSKDGMKLFGVMELGAQFHGCRFALGIRNSHDKSFRLSMTVGYRVFVCENLMFQGEYTPVLAKHTKNFSLLNALSVGVDDMQRNYTPMVQQVKTWQESRISDVEAKMVIYEAFISGELDVPRHLARVVHQNYFEPTHEEFESRSMWSLSNAFTSAFKVLDDPISIFRATAKLGDFLKQTS